jgi:hypothetical protein
MSTGELGCILLKPVLAEPFFDPCEEVSTRFFYSSRPGSYNGTQGPTGDPEVVETLYSINGPNG